MNNWLLTLVLVLLAGAGLPVVFYTAARLWAFGQMRGRQAYREWKERKDGETKNQRW